MKQIDFNYHNGQKGNWRRTVWNRIVERLSIHPSEAVAVYLAGHQDMDRPVALNKGFRPDNLISAERDSEVLRKLRDSGTLCVSGEFCDVVEAIASRRKVDVVFGDFCSGLEGALIWRLNRLIGLPNLKGAVMAFNFQRGRDRSSNGVRFVVSQHVPDTTKHRGILLWRVIESMLISGTATNLGMDLNSHYSQLNESVKNWTRCEWLPSDLTYRSGCASFDSIVFRIPQNVHSSKPDDFINRETWRSVPGQTKASLSAILAHRTMRLNGSIN